MASFEPFRGTTYSGLVKAEDVIAPPYDVVSPSDRAELATRSPYNAIHVELPVAGHGLDPYENASSLWRGWHEQGAVGVLEAAGYFVYRMSFADEDGSPRSTLGVLGALGLDPDHEGDVLPHEQTTPKDKRDRLSLLRAARTNFSPIWGLAVGSGLSEVCEAAAAGAGGGTAWAATDESGVRHERWTVVEPEAVDRIRSVVAAAPVLLADGHHRYETACTFLGEEPAQVGADAVLAFVVELAEDQLAVQGIHRLLGGERAGAVPAVLEPFFEISPGPSDPIALRDAMVPAGALGLVTRDASWLLLPRPSLAEAVDDDLDSARLAHVLAELGIEDVRYQHGAALAASIVHAGGAEAAVLLRPVSVDQIARTAHGGRLMPPKSTFFHPKPRTGMVFRELDPT